MAYISPVKARNDFRDRWGTDDLSCLSRYDGLMYVRDQRAGGLVPGPGGAATSRRRPRPSPVLKVLPNLDVVAAGQAARPPPTCSSWSGSRSGRRRPSGTCEAGKVLEAVEQGLSRRGAAGVPGGQEPGPLPQTVEVFLDDLEEKAGQLADLGAARLIACRDADVARTLAHDRRLRNLCQLAGERHLVFRAADEAAVRRGLAGTGLRPAAAPVSGVGPRGSGNPKGGEAP